jgi:hypothetical protein
MNHHESYMNVDRIQVVTIELIVVKNKQDSLRLKGAERKGKERKGKEKKGKERERKERERERKRKRREGLRELWAGLLVHFLLLLLCD